MKEMELNKVQLFKSLFKHNRLFLRELLPNLYSETLQITPDEFQLQEFNDLVGWTDTSHLAPTWLQMHVLPVWLNLITDPEFPFSPLGLVHVSNQVTLYRALPSEADYQVRCKIDEYQQHPKGVLFKAKVDAWLDNHLIYHADANILALVSSLKKRNRPKSKSPVLAFSRETSEQWHLSEDIGKRYARISGDYNPIHLNPWLAKIFGFKRHIAHGMFLNAKALSSLLAIGFAGETSFPLRMSIDFKKPVFLPAEVTLGHTLKDNDINFDLWNESSLYATGRIDWE